MDSKQKSIIPAILAVLIISLLIRATPQILYGPISSGQQAIEILSMKQAIASNYHLVPNNLSGYGTSIQANKIYAEQGLIYMAIYAYSIFGKLVGIIGTLIVLRILFTILAVIVIYLFVMELTENRVAGILACTIYAISSIGLGIEAFTIFKGEGFITIILITCILLILYVLKEKSKIKIFIYIALIAMLLILGWNVWNGGLYVIIATGFVCLSLAIAKCIKSKKSLLVCIGIIIVIATIGLFTTRLNSTFALVSLQPQPEPYANISIGQGIMLNTMQAVSQVEPIYPQINLFYLTFLSNKSLISKLPYLIWAIIGFMTTTLLAIITGIKLKFNTTKQRNAFIALITLIFLGLPLAIVVSSWWTLLFFIPICILAGASYEYTKENKPFLIIIAILLMASFTLTMWQTQAFNLGPVPQFSQATNWIQNNTAINSKFITMPGDGSAIEYSANRTSYIDTDASSNPVAVAQVGDFFFAKAYNFSFLEQVNYSYVLVEQDWSTPAGSGYIALDGNLPANTSVNGTNLKLLAPAGPWGSGGSNNIYSNNVITLKEVYNTNGILIYHVIR